MRENRPSGSEGGGAPETGRSLPLFPPSIARRSRPFRRDSAGRAAFWPRRGHAVFGHIVNPP
jgi:hypothetical protein